jgi:hypothetical protein
MGERVRVGDLRRGLGPQGGSAREAEECHGNTISCVNGAAEPAALLH